MQLVEPGGFFLRTWTSIALGALALAGTVGAAAAQYAPPQPPPAYPAYPSGAPTPPPYPPPSYSSAPLPPPDDAPVPAGRYGGPPLNRADAYPAQDQPAYGPDSRFPPQPLPLQAGAPDQRPPGNVGGYAPPPPSRDAGGYAAPAEAPPGYGPPAARETYAAPPDVTGAVPGQAGASPAQGGNGYIAALPPEDQPEQNPPKELAPQFRRQLVDYQTKEPAGTIIVDTPHTYLYLILGHGQALRYGIGVGREGFTWSGTERISRMKEWPDWFPPKEMIERQPYLPRFMAGGESNPLGARALYLGNTLYRIHGTNQPSTIGTFVSSGCIRLTNADIEDLYSRVNIGTRVVVLPGPAPNTASVAAPTAH